MGKYIFLICTVVLIGSIMGILGFSTNIANAAPVVGFTPGNIIDDYTFTNRNSMNVGQIQTFLNSKVPNCDTNGTQTSEFGGGTRAQWAAARGYSPPFTCLKDYSENGRSAAQIIYDAAQAYNVNPQVLIVLLQKEQGLVTDTWPLQGQYRTATGYGCPDTAACDSQYFGLTNQLTWSAKMFRAIMTNSPTWYTPYVLGNNYIQWSPTSSCGGSTVNIMNRATQALYNYTPYQPNQAALNAGYGTGDGCSAYGNRNFYLYFSDWFGSTKADGYTLAISDDGNPTQYVIYSGVKQAIPDTEVKKAWGLDTIPLTTLPASYIASVTTGPPLDRVMRVNNDPTVYFVDGGKRYRIPWDNMFDAWNLRSKVISRVSPGLFAVTNDGGDLTYAVKRASTSTIYVVDGANSSGKTVLRPYANIDIYRAWEGMGSSPTTISDDLFNILDDAIGTTIVGTRLTAGDADYQIVNSHRLWQTTPVSSIYSGTGQNVSWATISRLSVGPNITQLIKSPTSPVYIVDNGVRYPLGSSEALNAWSTPTQDVTVVNNSFLNLIPEGTAISGYVAKNGDSNFIINRRKIPIPLELSTAYENVGSVFNASNTLLALYPSTSAATQFIKSNDSNTVYLLDDSGKRRPISSSTNLQAWGGSQSTYTELSFYIVNQIAIGTDLGVYVTHSGENYLIYGGKKWTVDSNVATEWGLSSPKSITDTTLNRLTTAGDLQTKMRTPDGAYYLISEGRAYKTNDTSIADVWGIRSVTLLNDNELISATLRTETLYRFARSNQLNDNRTFIVESGNWYTATATPLANVGGNNIQFTTLNPSVALNTISTWGSMVVKAGDGTHFVIDGGMKHPFLSTDIRDQWTGGDTILTVSNGFLDLLAISSYAQKSIKGIGPGVFKVEGSIKRYLGSLPTIATYAPHMNVSEALLNSLSTGTMIP